LIIYIYCKLIGETNIVSSTTVSSKDGKPSEHVSDFGQVTKAVQRCSFKVATGTRPECRERSLSKLEAG
jgi:hypothetical protein